jgi:hypothetical protein
MIPPRQQWCIQIDVTNKCNRACANCTRSLSHTDTPFVMDVQTFTKAVDALAEFPDDSEPHKANNGTKVIGIIGGEPLMHPQFSELCRLVAKRIPRKRNRGLWTGLPLKSRPERPLIRQTFGYLNHNMHVGTVMHQPILVAIQDVVSDKQKMWRLIDDCWVQRMWSSTITPKGFFFCEVAAALDMIMDGPGGLPVEPNCWRHDMDAYREQIERWCPKCGAAVPLSGRRDSEQVDDISESNLETLRALGSPRIAKGDYRLFDIDRHATENDWAPHRYKRPEAKS